MVMTTIRNAFGPGIGAMGSPNASTEQTEQAVARIVGQGLSQRQIRLNTNWAWYLGLNYSNRNFEWDGGQHLDQLSAEAVGSSGTVPADYWQNKAIPLKFRRPTAPYRLSTVIVDRFTGLLFSAKRHPTFVAAGALDVEDYAKALADASRLWSQMIQARQYGGAMGAVALSFKFYEGKPRVEVHDPRWCFPKWKDREDLVLQELEKLYTYPEEERDERTGKWKQVWYWYRRVIDEARDVVYEPVKVDQTTAIPSQVKWVEKVAVDHNYGFCPAVWVQNTPTQDDIDGATDCAGTYETLETIDALSSQAIRGTTANCDPTLALTTDDDIDEMKKGSGNAIRIPLGGSAQYLEIQGGGITAARGMVADMRAQVLEVTQCVLEHPDVAGRTATEVERTYSSMLAKADVLREQYGQRGVLPLVRMMVKAARIVEGRGERIILPPRMVVPDDDEGEDGEETEEIERKPEAVERKLGPEDTDGGGVLDLAWHDYFDPTVDEAVKAAGAAGAAKTAGLLDDEHATKFVAPYFGVEDPTKMLRAMRKKAREERERMEEQMSLGIAGAQEGAVGGEKGDDKKGAPMPGKPEASGKPVAQTTEDKGAQPRGPTPPAQGAK